MTGYLNKVQLIGRLGKDPETHHSSGLNKTTTFTLATSEAWNDKSTGQLTTRTEWHKVAIFNERVGDIASQYLKKGDLIYLEGQIRTREWIDREGGKHFTTEIVIPKFKGEIIMLSNKEKSKESNDKAIAPNIDLDDEIPF